MREPSAIAAKYEAEAARSLDERGRWPLKWTVLFAAAVSLALWALIFAAARALWTLLV